MTAYLVLYGDVRKYLLSAADHQHGVGEDTSRCRNCLLEREAAGMSAFERFVWTWYTRNVTPLVLESGMLGRMVERLGLDETRERMFMRGLNEVRQFVLRIQAADAGK